MSAAEPVEAEPAAIKRWLSIIGIGEDGVDGLSPVARGLIESASIVFGGSRHLALAASLIRGTTHPWRSPFESNVPDVMACRGTAVCVLASGDPFQHGVGSVLARHIAVEETIAVPSTSAFSLAASRLLWPLPETTLLSLCGRSLDFVRPHLQNGARLLILTSDSRTPIELALLLSKLGFGESMVTVLEALGADRERIRTARANAFDLKSIDALNTLAVQLVAGSKAHILARAAGLADNLFEHDGQITKREIRALTLSALAPRHGEHLWDIGAGSGSVSIEWLLAHTSLTAESIEPRADRAACIRRNAAAFGVPHLEVVEGSAPAALEKLSPPHAVFIGGGATTPGLIDAVRAALLLHGRLVVNAVTLQTERLLLAEQAQSGGTLTRIEISRVGPVGGEDARWSGWRPAMPVLQWTWVKS